MKTILILIKFFSLVLFLSTSSVDANELKMLEPCYDKVYRSSRIGDSYHFLLLTKEGMFYHLYTNRTDTLTPEELKSWDLLKILKKKQSWGQSFPKSGKYIINNNKIYTQLLWDRIKVTSKTTIKYLNKTFKLQ